MFIAGIFGFFLWVDFSEKLSDRRNCPACQTGSVLFTDKDDSLCYRHYRRRQHIELLEWKMDRMD